jgi:hypothetical protein
MLIGAFTAKGAVGALPYTVTICRLDDPLEVLFLWSLFILCVTVLVKTVLCANRILRVRRGQATDAPRTLRKVRESARSIQRIGVVALILSGIVVLMDIREFGDNLASTGGALNSYYFFFLAHQCCGELLAGGIPWAVTLVLNWWIVDAARNSTSAGK